LSEIQQIFNKTCLAKTYTFVEKTKSMSKLFKLLIALSLGFITISCSKNNNSPVVEIEPVVPTTQVSVIVLLGDGMGIAQLTAAWHEHQSLNLEKFPHSGLVLTHSADLFVTESSAAMTAMMTGIKTNYGFLGVDTETQSLETLYDYFRKNEYKTAIITSSFLTDATPAALYSEGTNRYDYENIALDFYRNYPDFAVAGGRNHFDQREDQLNLLDSLHSKGIQTFYNTIDIQHIGQLPALGLLYPLRPPYLSEGRENFLELSADKAIHLFGKNPFFMLVEGALIDKAGHDLNIDNQIEETLEFDRIAGNMLDIAKTRNDILVVVLADHECGGLTLLQGENGAYIPNYAIDEHSGEMVACFAYGPGSELFSGIMDNTKIFYSIKSATQTKLRN